VRILAVSFKLGTVFFIMIQLPFLPIQYARFTVHQTRYGAKMSNSILQSFQKNKKGILLMFVSSCCVCLGQLLWKLIPSFGILFFLGGFAIYGLGAIIMFVAYHYGSLSVLQPMMSLNYVITAILATMILIIVIGVVLIGGGDET
jgi:drug/metabolite transporter (DMT)-like permease